MEVGDIVLISFKILDYPFNNVKAKILETLQDGRLLVAPFDVDNVARCHRIVSRNQVTVEERVKPMTNFVRKICPGCLTFNMFTKLFWDDHETFECTACKVVYHKTRW